MQWFKIGDRLINLAKVTSIERAVSNDRNFWVRVFFDTEGQRFTLRGSEAVMLWQYVEALAPEYIK